MTSSLDEPPPNLNPPLFVVVSDKVPPNLNPPKDEEESEDGVPNLNPADEEESERVPPNLKPPLPEVESNDDEEEPNLKPPELDCDDTPKEEDPKALGSTLAPGLAVWQATHWRSAALLLTQHVSHSQLPSGFLNLSPKPSRGAELAGVAGNDDGAPGLALVQATHLLSSALF